jgi:hypothetical protein
LRVITTISNDFATYQDWLELLRNADQHVDLMGFTLMIWTQAERFEETVLRLTSAGCDMWILVMDEARPQFARGLDPGGLPVAASKDGIVAKPRTAMAVFREIERKTAARKPERGGFEVRTVRHGSIKCHICRIDDVLLVVPYLSGSVGANSPLLEVNGRHTELFRIYQNEFDRLGAANPPDN